MTADLRLLLTRLPGCARLSEEALSRLAEAARREDHPPGHVLFGEGQPAPDWFCIVLDGALQVSVATSDGAEILDYLSEGEILDPGPPGMPAARTASVVERARCLLVPRVTVEMERATAPAVTAPVRGETVLFVASAREILKGPALTCRLDTTVADAAREMTRRRVGSVVVVSGDGTPIGIMTDRDLRSRVVAEGRPASTPVGAVMTSPMLTIAPEEPAIDALLEMTRRNVHHLPVIASGRLEGVISSHDLIWLQGAHPVALAREIEAEHTLEGLAGVAPRVQDVVRWLVDGGADPFHIGRIVAELNDRLVRRALVVTEAMLDAEGHGRPPVPYSWVAAGSEGRREQTLKTDQDDGIVYADPAEDGAEAAHGYFARLGAAGTEALLRLGFPACPGGYMASTPRWCQPASVWRGYFASWMENPHPEPLLHAAIFFDLRPIAGDEEPGRALWEWVCEEAPSRALFLRYMARAATERTPPLGFFGGFVVERSGAHEGTLDLKARGVFPMTQAMRVHALSLGLRETNTIDRLLRAGPQVGLTAPQVKELYEAYAVMCRLRLMHQLARIEAGKAADNFIDPRDLGKADRLLLKEAFKTVGWLLKELEGRFLTAALP